MPKLPKHLEEAILKMPEKEKNKILLRLISKDTLLTDQLEHGLLGDESDMIDRRNEILDKMEAAAKNYNYYSPSYLLMEMRAQSGKITYHYKVTKDKFGEVLLLASLINLFFKHNLEVLNEKKWEAEPLAVYVVKKAVSVISKAKKLHEDYHIELEDVINEALGQIHNYGPAREFVRIFLLPKKFN